MPHDIETKGLALHPIVHWCEVSWFIWLLWWSLNLFYMVVMSRITLSIALLLYPYHFKTSLLGDLWVCRTSFLSLTQFSTDTALWWGNFPRIFLELGLGHLKCLISFISDWIVFLIWRRVVPAALHFCIKSLQLTRAAFVWLKIQ